MSKCSCGRDNHMDQIKNYPVGAKVHFSDGKVGKVFGHCEDGRAQLYMDGRERIFHDIELYVERIELPPPTVEELQAENQRLRSQVERLTAQLERIRDGDIVNWQPISTE